MTRIRFGIAFVLLFVVVVSSPSFGQVGTMETGEITSTALGGVTRKYLVYLPPSYTVSEKEYPSIYVLHGLTQDYLSRKGMSVTLNRMIQNGEIGEMIAVFVDADDSYYVNEYEPYIVSELVDHIDARYRTIPDRESRGITGYSMGGFGAMHLALKYPEVFAVTVPQAADYEGSWGPPENSGYYVADYLEEDLERYLDRSVRPNGIKIVHGRKDYVYRARRWVQKLTDLGIDHEYVEHGGEHIFIDEESLGFLSDHLHPVNQIARLREGISVTMTPGAALSGDSSELTVTLDVPPEYIESVQGIFLDLSSLDLSSELPLEHVGEGRYTLRHTVDPRSGSYLFPIAMESAFEWDIQGTRYPLVIAEWVVYPAGDKYSLYHDEMASEWEVNIPTTATLNLAASDVAAPEGSYAQTIEMPSGYLKYIYQDPDGFSTFGYTTLQFWLNPGTASTETARLAVKTTEGTDYPMFREDLGITLKPDVWQLLSIPLDELGLVGTNRNLKELQFRGIEGTFYIDDLAFVIAEYGLEEAVARPERIKADGMMATLLMVETEPAVTVVEPGAPPAVTVDLAPIGGERDAVMFDDGTGGDRITGDRIYTIEVTVPPEISNGLKDLIVSSTDRHLRVVRAHIPLAVLPLEDMYVYRDEIASGWTVGVRNVLSDPSATAFVYDGAYAQEISVERSSNFMNYTWDDAEGFDAFGYTDLVFQVLVTEPEQDPLLILTPAIGNALSFRLGDQLGEPGVWQEIWIPLGGLADAGFMLKRFSFQSVDATLYLDDVRFVAEEVLVSSEPTAVEVSEGSIVLFGYMLSQNHPNPFNPETTIRYELSETGAVRLSLYNVSGQLIRTLVDGERFAGTYSVTWDGRDDSGRDVASGVYVSQMEVAGFRAVRKLVLVR